MPRGTTANASNARRGGGGRGRGGSGKGGGASDRKAKPRSFDEFYREVYGERWPALREAMCAPAKKVALWNRFCQLPFEEVTAGLVRVYPDSVTQAFRPAAEAVVAAGGYEGEEEDDESIAKPPVDAYNVKAYYLLDYASSLIVEQLQVGPFDKVLDLCAAPGGKSVAICQFLSPDGELTANEVRADRCARLRRNLREHVPVNYVPWKSMQRDGQTWYDPNSYSRVLVDAPCSSERHLLHQSAGAAVPLREWSEESSTTLAALQRTLLQRAMETCREGGRIVYSTCSLSPLENDGVVAEALRCTRCEIAVIPPEKMHLGEPTKLGWIVLPDVAEGWGPMYVCVLHKTSNQRKIDSSSSEEDEDSSDDDNDDDAS